MDTIKTTVIIGRDSLVSKFNEASGEYYVYMKEMDTDWTGVIIVCIVCATIMVIAGLIYRYFRYEQKECRNTIDKNKRDQELCDREWKRKGTLEDKLLDYLKDKKGSDEYKIKLEEMLSESMSSNNEVLAKNEKTT